MLFYGGLKPPLNASLNFTGADNCHTLRLSFPNFLQSYSSTVLQYLLSSPKALLPGLGFRTQGTKPALFGLYIAYGLQLQSRGMPEFYNLELFCSNHRCYHSLHYYDSCEDGCKRRSAPLRVLWSQCTQHTQAQIPKLPS